MSGLTLVLVLCGLGVLCGVPWVLAVVARRSAHDAGRALGEPRSPVRVLRGDDELEEAIERALRYDRAAEDTLHRRIDRYTKADNRHSATVIDLPTNGSGADTAGTDQRTATA